MWLARQSASLNDLVALQELVHIDDRVVTLIFEHIAASDANYLHSVHGESAHPSFHHLHHCLTAARCQGAYADRDRATAKRELDPVWHTNSTPYVAKAWRTDKLTLNP